MEASSTLRSDDEIDLEKRILNGDAYEASQLYLGHMGRLRASGLFNEAEGVGIRGVIALMNANEPSLATPLALTVIESFSSRTKAMDPKTYELLLVLVKSFDLDQSSEVALKQKNIVTKAACKLANHSKDALMNPYAQNLHGIRASDLAKAGQVADAAKHFSVANQPEEYAQFIHRWSSLGYESEKELFGVRAVLHVLSLGSETGSTARILFNKLIELKVLGSNASPLENFLTFVFELMEQLNQFTIGQAGARSVFSTLLTSYKPALSDRDPRLLKLAESIGQHYFGWTPPPNPMKGIMDMFK